MSLADKDRYDLAYVLEDYFFDKGWMGFGLAVLASWANIWMLNELVLTDAVYYNSFGDRLTGNRISDMLAFQEKWQWATYLLVPLLIAAQVFLISLCMWAGAITLDWKMHFRGLFRLVMQVFGFMTVLRLLPTFLLTFREVSVLDDLVQSDWYSVLALLGREQVPDWLHLPLMGINFFHAVFVFLLGLGLALWDRQKPFSKGGPLGILGSTGFVLGSYGSGVLLLWLIVVFLQLNARG